MRVALVAGEASGDILGAALIRALRARFPHATFYGVAGPRMVEAGCEVVASVDEISVMGLVEVLHHLPRLVRLRRRLAERFTRDRPDVFIGVDAPDFNLGLARILKARGLRTVHFVSPTIWAWRPGRVHSIARSVDLMLCMYPFEPPLYERVGTHAAFVGHPLADELDDSVPEAAARAELGLTGGAPIVAMLPGSRPAELRYLAEPFAHAVAWVAARMPGLHCVVPVAAPALRPAVEAAVARHPGPVWHLLDGRSRTAMRAADAVLLASGTATLEGLLLGRPMVVGYRGSPVTAFLMLRAGLLRIKHVAMANILSPEPAVPELLQSDLTPERLGQELLLLLRHPVLRERQRAQFDQVRRTLRQNFADRAAAAVQNMLAAGG